MDVGPTSASRSDGPFRMRAQRDRAARAACVTSRRAASREPPHETTATGMTAASCSSLASHSDSCRGVRPATRKPMTAASPPATTSQRPRRLVAGPHSARLRAHQAASAARACGGGIRSRRTADRRRRSRADVASSVPEMPGSTASPPYERGDGIDRRGTGRTKVGHEPRDARILPRRECLAHDLPLGGFGEGTTVEHRRLQPDCGSWDGRDGRT